MVELSMVQEKPTERSLETDWAHSLRFVYTHKQSKSHVISPRIQNQQLKFDLNVNKIDPWSNISKVLTLCVLRVNIQNKFEHYGKNIKGVLISQ